MKVFYFLYFTVLLNLCSAQVHVTVVSEQVYPGELAYIDIIVNDFEDISSMQFSVNWDSEIATFHSIDGISTSLVQFGLDNFGTPAQPAIDEGELAITWSLASAESVTIDQTDHLLFRLVLEPIYPLPISSAISISGTPRAIEFVNGNSEIVELESQEGVLKLSGNVKFFLTDQSFQKAAVGCANLKASDFYGIQSFQYAIEYDESILNFDKFSNFSPKIDNLNGAIVMVEPGLLRVAWADFSGLGVNLPDDEVLCSICFTVQGETGDMTELQFTDNLANGIEVTNSNNEIIPFVLESASISIVNSCTVTAEYPEKACVGETVNFVANPSFGDPEPNTNAINGQWIVDGFPVTDDDIDGTFGMAGKTFTVGAASSVNFEDFFESIQIEFHDAGTYNLQYFYNFTSCSETVDLGSIVVNDLPLEILSDATEKVCFGENAIVDLDIVGSSILIATYELDGQQEVDTFSNAMSTIFVNNIEEKIDIKFINLVDTVSECVLALFENEYTILPFDPLSSLNLSDSCVTDEGQYFSKHQLSGGSGYYEFVESKAGGDVLEDIYISESLGLGQLDTLTIRDTFCISPIFEFPLTNSCACTDSTAIFENSTIYEACETDVIELNLQQSSKSSNAATSTILRTYEKIGTELNFLDELVITDENEALIPYKEEYTNGKNYFARSYITSFDGAGEVNYSDFCIDSSSQEIIFRFFQNPDAQILGAMEVCKNQSEVLFQPTKIQSNTSYSWLTPADTEIVAQGNGLYVKFLESGDFLFELEQTYFPQISATDISCFGAASMIVNVSTDIAPERSDIVFFEPNFLSLSTTEDYCVQWFTVDRFSGERIDFGTEKQWAVQDYQPDNFFYGVETKFPTDGNCDFDGYCETIQFFNKGPITEINDAGDFRPNIKVFPNPTSGILSIEFEGEENWKYVSVMDALGRLVMMQERTDAHVLLLDVGSLTPSLYFAKVKVGSLFYVVPFIKE